MKKTWGKSAAWILGAITLLNWTSTPAFSEETTGRIEWTCEGDETLSGTLPLSPQFFDNRLIYSGFQSVPSRGGVPNYLFAGATVTRRPSGRSIWGVGICSLGFAIKDSRGFGGNTRLEADISGGPGCVLTVANGVPFKLYGLHALDRPVDQNPQFICTVKLFLPRYEK